MKKIISLLLVAILTLSLSCCGKNQEEETAPYFKGVKWGDSIETVKEIEKGCDMVVTNEENKVILTCKESNVPFFDDLKDDIKYIFEENGLDAIEISIVTSDEKAEKRVVSVKNWLDKYYRKWEEKSDSEMDIYVSNADNRSVTAFAYNSLDKYISNMEHIAVTMFFYEEGVRE